TWIDRNECVPTTLDVGLPRTAEPPDVGTHRKELNCDGIRRSAGNSSDRTFHDSLLDTAPEQVRFDRPDRSTQSCVERACPHSLYSDCARLFRTQYVFPRYGSAGAG